MASRPKRTDYHSENDIHNRNSVVFGQRYPAGFLRQLGAELGAPVRLERSYTSDENEYSVMAGSEIIGVYRIFVFQGSPFAEIYDGDYPGIGLIRLEKLMGERRDKHKEIKF